MSRILTVLVRSSLASARRPSLDHGRAFAAARGAGTARLLLLLPPDNDDSRRIETSKVIEVSRSRMTSDSVGSSSLENKEEVVVEEEVVEVVDDVEEVERTDARGSQSPGVPDRCSRLSLSDLLTIAKDLAAEASRPDAVARSPPKMGIPVTPGIPGMPEEEEDDEGSVALVLRCLSRRNAATMSVQDVVTALEALAHISHLATRSSPRDHVLQAAVTTSLTSSLYARASQLARRLPLAPRHTASLLASVCRLSSAPAPTPAPAALGLALSHQTARSAPDDAGETRQTRRSQSEPDAFSDSQLADCLRGLARLGHRSPPLVRALERRLAAPGGALAASPELVGAAAGYVAAMRESAPAVLDALAFRVVYAGDGLEPRQLAQVLVAMGHLNHIPSEEAVGTGAFFRKVENLLEQGARRYPPSALLALLHGASLLTHLPANHVSRAFSPLFLQQLDEEESGLTPHSLARLTQLFLSTRLECPFYEGNALPPAFRVRSLHRASAEVESTPGGEQRVRAPLYAALATLLGGRGYLAQRVLTPYGYTLDMEVKMDEEGFVLPGSHRDDVHTRVALCLDGPRRFCANARVLLGREAIKQRHLKLLGYRVVQIPFYELDALGSRQQHVDFLHSKLFPHSFRLQW